MLLSDFGPYITPHVIDCPIPTISHNVRLAAIEFCRKTLCWTRQLELVQIYGGTPVELEPDTDTQIIKIKSVMVDGRDWPMVTAEDGERITAQGVNQDYCYTDDGITLNVFPVQANGTTVVVRAALAPTLGATSFNSSLDEFAEDIANGAIARIKRIANQDFTDLAGSQLHDSLFKNRINTVAAKTSRGIANAFIRGRVRYF